MSTKRMLRKHCRQWLSGLLMMGLLTPLTGLVPVWAVFQPVLQETLNAALREHQEGLYQASRNRLYAYLQASPNDPIAVAALCDLYLREVRLYQLSRRRLPVSDIADRRRIERLLTQAYRQTPSHPKLKTAWQNWQLTFGPPKWPVTGEERWQETLQPEASAKYRSLSRQMLAEGRLEDAKQLGMVALELGPEQGDSYFLIGQLLAATEHWPEALRYTTQATKLTRPPTHAQLLLLAELYEQLEDPQNALAYYRKAGGPTTKITELTTRLKDAELSQTPALPPAKTDLRLFHQEKQALDINTLLPCRSPQHTEAWQAIAALAYAQARAGRPPSVLLALAQELPPSQTNDTLQLAAVKLQLALNKAWTPQEVPEHLQNRLKVLALGKDDMAAGEALFLLGKYQAANERLDAVDGQTAEGYLAVADILLLDQALTMADTMYRRGQQLRPLADSQTGLTQILQFKEQANHYVAYGDADLAAKKSDMALIQYEKACRLVPEWETPYLRLGELHRKRREYKEAYAAYQQAIQITPGLLTSRGFLKQYQSIQAKADPTAAAVAKRQAKLKGSAAPPAP